MIRKIIPEKTPYEKYFMTEAPAKRPYMKIVSAMPDKRLASFDKNIVDVDELDDEEELTGDDLVADDDTDFDSNIEGDMADLDISGEEEPTDDELDLVDDTEIPEPIDDADVEDEAEPVEAEAPAGNTTTELQTEPPGGDAGAADDFDANITDDGTGDDSMGDDTADDTTAGGGEQTGTTVPNTEENQLKLALYRNMKDLYLAVRNYYEKLDGYTSGSYNYVIVMKSCASKLANLEEVMFQYMTIRFKTDSYTEAMCFYQKCLATVKLIFEMLRANEEKEKSNSKTIN